MDLVNSDRRIRFTRLTDDAVAFVVIAWISFFSVARSHTSGGPSVYTALHCSLLLEQGHIWSCMNGF